MQLVLFSFWETEKKPSKIAKYRKQKQEEKKMLTRWNNEEDKEKTDSRKLGELGEIHVPMINWNNQTEQSEAIQRDKNLDTILK